MLLGIPLLWIFVSSPHLFIYLFNHLFISICIQKLLFYTLCYDPKLICFVAQMAPDLAIESIYFLVQYDVPGSSCALAVSIPAIQSVISTRSSGSFYWRIVFRNQDFGTRYTLLLVWLYI